MIPRRFARRAVGLLVLSLALSSPGSMSAASDIELRPVEDAAMGISTVVPADWHDRGGGLYAKGDYPAEPTLLAIQSVPASVDQLWPSLLPQLRIEEIPIASGQLATDALDWTLYQVPVTLGETTLTVELAVAEDGGWTHLVVLQAPEADFDGLRQAVFVPAVEAFAVLAPETSLDPASSGYSVEEVTFPGGDVGVGLAGSLTLPAGDGPFPAVVLMSGSGAQDRDESLRPVSAIRPFALIADALSSAGVAVLRYDDRGVGSSSGDYASATIEDLAWDGAAALAYLRGRDDIDAQRIGVLGHSEGGLYAAMLAARDPGISFIVTLAGPAVDGVSLLVEQNEAITRASGATDQEIALARTFASTAMPAARDGDSATVEAAVRDRAGSIWDRATPAEQAVLGDRDAYIQLSVDQQLPALLSDWYRSVLAYDPAPDWERVQVPVLALFGGLDVQVLADSNAAAMEAAFAASGNEDGEVVVLPEANHLFQAATTGALEEYGSLDPEFTPELLPTLVAWVTEQAGLAEAA